jgi:hypothetical protein
MATRSWQGGALRDRQTRESVESDLRRWCTANGCDWGSAALLDRAELGVRLRSPADRCLAFALCTDGSELADVLAPFGRSRYRALNGSLQACLARHGLCLSMIAPNWAGLYRPAPPR